MTLSNESVLSPNKRPRVEVLMQRDAKQTGEKKKQSLRTPCHCKHRYVNKTLTEDRDCMSKKQYIKILSTPRTYPKPPREKKKKPITNTPCPPRIEELARPNPTRVLNTWQSYYDVLTTERMEKLQTLLYAISYMEPKKAIYHFKRLKAKQKRKGKSKKKSQPSSQAQLTMMQNEEMQVAKAIMEYFKEKPLANVKYRHMCISNRLLDAMEEKRLLYKPRRKTKNCYEKTLIEIADQVAVWFEKLVEELEVIEKKEAEEKILEVVSTTEEELSICGEEEEEEGGEEEEEEEEGEEEEEEEEESKYSVGSTASEPMGEGEGVVDKELLQKLIEILDNGDREILDEPIEPVDLPGVTHGDVLLKLKNLDPTTEPIYDKRGERLNDAIAVWAFTNDTEKFDPEMRDFVKSIAGTLAHLLSNEGEGPSDEDLFAKYDDTTARSEVEGYDELEPAFSPDKVGETENAAEPQLSGYEYDIKAEETMEHPSEAGEGSKSSIPTEEAIDEVDIPTTDDGLMMEVSSLEGDEAGAGEETGVPLEEGFGEDQDISGIGKVGDEEGAAPHEYEIMPGFEGEEEGEVLPGSERAMLMEGEEGKVPPGAGRAMPIEGEEEGAYYGEGEIFAEEEGLEEGAVPYGAEGEGEIEIGEEGIIPVGEEGVLPVGEEGVTPLGEKELTPEEKRAAAAAAEGKELVPTASRLPGVIVGHKPSKTFEHSPDGICCVSLKIYAFWLYEVAENAHNWSSWLIEIIQEVRNFTRIVKGEVTNPDGTRKVLKKDEWRQFVEKIEKMIVSWRQYSQHIGSLSERLMKTIHEKKVSCCPKCLSDNLIKDLAAASCLTEELGEAITTATYWRQWLDNMIDQTKRLVTIPVFTATTDGKKAITGKKKVCTTCVGGRSVRKPAKTGSFAPKRIQIHKAPTQGLPSSDEDDDDDVIYELEEIDPNKKPKPGSSRKSQ